MSGSPRRRSIRVLAIAAGVVVAAVAAALLVPLAASAAPTPVTGIVDGPNGKPMAGVTVEAVDVFYDGSAQVLATTTSSSTGTFGFTSDAVSMSTLWFGATSTTYAQYLGDTSNPQAAENLTYNPGYEQYTQATLAASGTVSGTVTELPKGNLAGYTVRAYDQQSDGSWAIDRTAVSSSTGAYSITGLEPGAYRLEAINLASASPAYAPSYSGGATELGGATSVGVLAAKTTTYKFALGKAGSVSGTVTGLHSSQVENLSSVHVTTYRLDGTPGSFTDATALDSPSAVTASTGKYTVGGLAPGYYTFEFSPPTTAPYSPSGTQYGRTFLGGSDSPTSASYVQIANGTVLAGKNIQLQAGATISGTVEDGSNSDDPVGDIQVSAIYTGRDADLPYEHAETVLSDDTTGAFTISGLGPGTYDLWVGSNSSTDSSPSNENYIRQVITVGPLTSGQDLVENPIMTPKLDGTLEATTQPSLSTTTAAVGDTVSIDPGIWNATDATFTYQWLEGDNVVIAGATGSSYTLPPGVAYDYLYARVTAHSFGYGFGTDTTSNVIQTVSPGTFATPSPAPSITGTSAVGQTLTAQPGNWGVSGTTFTFQWEVSSDGTNWDSMDQGQSQSVVVDGDDFDFGDQVRVEIYAQKFGYTSASVTVDDSSNLVTSPIQLVTPPTVVKTSTDYSLTAGVWNPTLVDAAPEVWSVLAPDGSSSEFNQVSMPIGSVAGDYVTVTMKHELAGWMSTTTAPIVAQIGAAASVSGGSTALTGTPVVGGLLSAPNPTWLPSSGTSTWQWQYESGTKWLNISGATASTYAPVAGDVGHLLRVVTTRNQTGFATGTLDSVASAKVALGAAPQLNAEGFAGTVGTGANVTVNPSWSPTPTTRGYQWEYSKTGSAGPWTKLAGATSSVYTIPQSLLGDWLAVYETAAIPGHTTATTTYPIGQVAEDELTLKTAPKITDAGGTYAVSGVTFSPAVPPADIKYTWVYYDENDSSYTVAAILGGPTYDIAASAFPKAHWGVVVAVTDDPGTSYTYASPAPVLAQKGSIVPSGPITLPAAQVGAGVAAPTITWLVQNPTLGYQWQYESGTKWLSIAASAGGTSATFTPSATYYNRNIRVIETASRANYSTASETSTSSLVALGAAPVAGTGADAPGINGYGIGATWSAFPGTWSVSGLTYHYQWAFSWTSSGPWIPITGATAATYAPPDDLLGYYLQVTITSSKTGYANGSTTQETPALQTGMIRLLADPKVTLSGGTYTVTNNGTWSPAASSYDYYWDIVNPATNASTQVSTTDSYTTSGADTGDLVELTMYPVRPGYNSGGITITVRQGPTIEPTSPITLTGTPVIGGTLQLNIPGWNTAGPFVAVTWYRNGVATGTDVNSTSYTPVAADLGDTITARVTASEAGDVTSTFTFTSAPVVSNVVLTASVAPTISGSLLIGTNVTATSGTWNVPGLAFAYQWYRNGVAIPGATSNTYQLEGPDFLTELTVEVTASKTNYTTQSALSQAVTVANSTTAGIVSNSLAQPITITGSHVAGTGVLTMSIGGTWNVPPTITVAWYVSTDGGTDWSYIAGQYGETLALTAANGIATGDEVEALVLAQAPGYYEDGVDSAPVTVQ